MLRSDAGCSRLVSAQKVQATLRSWGHAMSLLRQPSNDLQSFCCTPEYWIVSEHTFIYDVISACCPCSCIRLLFPARRRHSSRTPNSTENDGVRTNKPPENYLISIQAVVLAVDVESKSETNKAKPKVRESCVWIRNSTTFYHLGSIVKKSPSFRQTAGPELS